MAEKFVVYVSAPPEGVEAAGNRLAELLKLDPAKVQGLVRRLPAVVTRPVSEREARVAAERFQQAGFGAEIRTESGVPVGADPARVAEPDEEPEAPSPTDTAFGRASRVIPPPTSAAESSDLPEQPAPGADAAQAARAALGRAASVADAPVEAEPQAASAQASGFAGAAASSAAAVAEPAPAPSAPPARVPAPSAQPTAPDVTVTGFDETGRKKRRGSLRSKLLSTAIIPVLLTIVGALAATWFTARPALYDQLLASARNPAIATAATLSSTLERAGGEGIDHLQLLETILITRQAFARQNLSFILATDTAGNPYSGSFLGGTSFPEESLALQNEVRARAVHAIQEGASGRSGWAEEGATSHVEAAGGQRIEIVAQPLMSGDQAIGAVVVGVTDQAVTEQVNRIVINVLLFSLIPLLLAIFIAAVRARRLTDNVLTLTQKADEISRGDLDEPVDLRSNDELDDLSAALERMRVSMSGALERLRRRR